MSIPYGECRKVLAVPPSPSSLQTRSAARQDRLEMRGLFFGGDNADFDFFEARFFEPAMQIAFGKAQPAVTVKFVRFLEVVLEQVQNQELPAGLQNFVGAAQGGGGNFGVMKAPGSR